MGASLMIPFMTALKILMGRNPFGAAGAGPLVLRELWPRFRVDSHAVSPGTIKQPTMTANAIVGSIQDTGYGSLGLYNLTR